MVHSHYSLEPARSNPGGLRLVAAALLATLMACGCATLPDARADRAGARDEHVEFAGARGVVSEKRSDAIIDRLEGAHGESDLLDQHLAYEQAINADAPLVLGNKLTLLQNGPDTYQSMFAAIRSAQDHINLETFIFEDDEAGREFSELLL